MHGTFGLIGNTSQLADNVCWQTVARSPGFDNTRGHTLGAWHSPLHSRPQAILAATRHRLTHGRLRTHRPSAGTVDYEDTGGDPPVVVLLRPVEGCLAVEGPIAELSVDHRCVAPTLPPGAHRQAMQPTPTSPPGIARLVGEFLDRLTCTTSRSSATTPGSSSTCSSATARFVWDGSCWPPARRSTTSRRADRQGTRTRRQALAPDVRAVHAADAAPDAPAAPDRVRVADAAGGLRHRPVGEACHEPTWDPPRRCASPSGSSRRPGPHAGSSPTPAELHPSRPRRLGKPRSGDAARTVDASPSSFRKDGWSKWKTATPSSPWTSRPGSPRSSGSSSTHSTEPRDHLYSGIASTGQPRLCTG